MGCKPSPGSRVSLVIWPSFFRLGLKPACQNYRRIFLLRSVGFAWRSLNSSFVNLGNRLLDGSCHHIVPGRGQNLLSYPLPKEGANQQLREVMGWIQTPHHSGLVLVLENNVHFV